MGNYGGCFYIIRWHFMEKAIIWINDQTLARASDEENELDKKTEHDNHY